MKIEAGLWTPRNRTRFGPYRYEGGAGWDFYWFWIQVTVSEQR